jgi:hypothetical protein
MGQLGVIMGQVDRRSFLRASAGALTLASFPELAFAQTAPTPPVACVTSGLPPFLPSRLTVDCASKVNFAVYRKNAAYMGLAGCVSMTTVQGKYGVYTAGNLFLFPWLNKKGQAYGAAKDWQTAMPTSATALMAAPPIPNWRLPLDEYFIRYRLVAQPASFIGFRVDAPFNLQDSRRPWFTNVEKLADGLPVGIGWNSSNLNQPWFGGSRFIPSGADCNGNKWRALIIDGLNQASANGCGAPGRPVATSVR